MVDMTVVSDNLTMYCLMYRTGVDGFYHRRFWLGGRWWSWRLRWRWSRRTLASADDDLLSLACWWWRWWGRRRFGFATTDDEFFRLAGDESKWRHTSITAGYYSVTRPRPGTWRLTIFVVTDDDLVFVNVFTWRRSGAFLVFVPEYYFFLLHLSRPYTWPSVTTPAKRNLFALVYYRPRRRRAWSLGFRTAVYELLLVDFGWRTSC